MAYPDAATIEVVESDTLDPLDRQLLHALQVNGRAGFGLLGRVLDVSDRTVARRYARLSSAAALRVHAVTDPHLRGETQWYVRVRATPDAALPVAQAMARRSDTSWVRLISGGTEIVCAARSRTSADPGALLLGSLRRTARILDMSAQSELHVHARGVRRLLEESGPLRDDQRSALRRNVAAPAEVSDRRPVRLDDTDRALLSALHRDGRATVDELATTCRTPPTTVRRRLEQLQANRVLRFDLDIDPRALGLAVHTLLWVNVAPTDLHATGAALATHPEVAFAAATTGRTNLYASVLSPDAEAFYRYLTTRVAALPAVRDVESVPVVRTLKGAAPPA